ncbi:MAG: tetratricopeptide repeat protein [Candidatus Omnitrophota bacterium]
MIKFLEDRRFVLVILCVGIFLLSGYSYDTSQEDVEILSRARSSSIKGSWKQGIAEYNEYLAKHPDSHVTKKELGILYAWDGNWAKAREFLEKYIERVPTDVEALEILGDAYLYDNKYQQAEAIYKKIIEIDSVFEPALRKKIKQAKIAMASYPAYAFSYYQERNTKTPYKSTSRDHEWSWNQHVQNNFYLAPSYGIRIDEILQKVMPIYGLGCSSKVFDNSYFSFNAKYEKNRYVNRKWRTRALFSTVPKDSYTISLSQDTAYYWDGNASYSGTVNASKALLKDKSFIVLLSFFYDQIKKTSAYFVRIKPPLDGNMSKPLNLMTAGLTLDKSFKINDALSFNVGSSAKVNTDSNKIFNFFCGSTFKLFDNVNLNLYSSYGYDKEHYEYYSLQTYTSFFF